VVVFAHGWDEAFEHLLSRRFSRLFQLMYGRADAFIVLGQEFKRKLRRLGYERQVFVQGAPIDDQLLEDCGREQIRKGADRSKFNLLFLARLEREKGIYEALDTYRLLKREYPYITMTVAGDGSERARAAAYAKSANLEDVTFQGYVEGNAKYEVYRKADAYLFPSYTEGLPISVLEAMAYGLPIVTCAVGGLPDFFRHGTMGFVTEKPNPEILASLVSRLIVDPALASRIGHFNSNYAREQFNGPHIAADLEGVYRFLLEGADRTLLPAR
jgi:glycosyltransferase involved in cell wall biosynthesis